MNQEDKKEPIRVTYEFCLPEHKYDLKKFQVASDMVSALYDIDELCRRFLKNRDCSRDTEIFVESIREYVTESGVRDLE